MSDLSRLLGDVYGSGPVEEAVPAEDLADETVAEDGTPTWADESVLDEAFADWVPGPPADAPAAEHEVLAPVETTAEAPATLAEALPEAAEWFFDDLVTDEEPTTVATVVDLPAVEDGEDGDTVVAPVWQRSDDDLLPARRGRRR